MALDFTLHCLLELELVCIPVFPNESCIPALACNCSKTHWAGNTFSSLGSSRQLTGVSKGPGNELCSDELNKWEIAGKHSCRRGLRKLSLIWICVISQAFCLQLHGEMMQNRTLRGLNFFSLFYYSARNLTNDRFSCVNK